MSLECQTGHHDMVSHTSQFYFIFLWLISSRQLRTMCFIVKVLHFFICHTILLLKFGWYHTTFIQKAEWDTPSPTLPYTTIPSRSSLSPSFYCQKILCRHVNSIVRWWPISFLEELFELLRKWLWKIFQLLYRLVVFKDVLLRVWKILIIAFHWQAYPSRLPEWHDMIPWFIS